MVENNEVSSPRGGTFPHCVSFYDWNSKGMHALDRKSS